MKLAEALMKRADTQKRLDQLKKRLKRNAQVQEDDEPAEDPQTLLQDIERMVDDLESLIQRINRTNAATELDDGLTITDALARRDTLRRKHKLYRTLADEASITPSRFGRQEIRFKSTVDVTRVQKQADDFAQVHRELDLRIQEANWQTELLD